jgi:hypothetical protein
VTGQARAAVPTDDAIREMLESRANRATLASIDLATIIAAAGPRSTRASVLAARLVPRVSLVATMAAVLVVSALIVLPIVDRPVGSNPPGDSAVLTSPTAVGASASTPPTNTVRLLSPGELGDLARTRSAELATTLAVVNGHLDLEVGPDCAQPSACGGASFANSGDGFRVRLLALQSLTIPPTSSDAFVVRFTTDVERGLPVLDVLGPLARNDSSALTMTVEDLISDRLAPIGSYIAVDGWLVRSPLHPCPSIDEPSPTTGDLPRYGCPDDEYLTDTAFQPLQADGSSIGTDKALSLPVGSYDQWAPQPARFGTESVGVEPRRATYLLERIGCPPWARCAAPPLGSRRWPWRIVGLLDPIPGIPSSPAQSGPTPSSGAIATTRSVAELSSLAVPPEPGDYVVRAFLVATPPIRCRFAPGPYDCGELDWLTDETFQPWIADGIHGSARPPAVGLRVQAGAYDAFAPDPVVHQFGAHEPRFATYRVRLSIHSSCEYVLPTSAPLACLGKPLRVWEVVERLR